MAENADNALNNYFPEPSPRLPPWQAFRKFLWDSETRKVLGRTGESWGKLTAFYILFYAVLAALCAIFFALFILTINYKSPKWQLDHSLIGTSPGLAFRPIMTNASNADSILLQIRKSDKENIQFWVDNLMELLDDYYSPRKFVEGNGTVKSCSYTKPPSKDEVCEVNVGDWGPCSQKEGFQYNRSQPCVFLKLNRICGWIPEPYINENELPSEMPTALKDHIKKITDPVNRNNVWVSCEGHTADDKQHIGNIKYYPEYVQGFPGYYFPYLNQESYLSPLVAVHFENPKSGVNIRIECRAWAKNIKYNRADRIGTAHFQLHIDN